MTREKAIKEYVIPALMHTWNEKTNKKVLEAIEQDPILDKIRAKIKEVYNDRPDSNNHPQRTELFCEVMKVIDKVESEDKE